jgi:hypothetical protein
VLLGVTFVISCAQRAKGLLVRNNTEKLTQKVTLKIIENEASYAKTNDDLKERNKALLGANKHLKSNASRIVRKSQKEMDKLQEL